MLARSWSSALPIFLLILQIFTVDRALAFRCQDYFKAEPLAQGKEVTVTINDISLLGKETWVAGSSKDLVFIGRTLKNEDVNSDVLLFADAQLNTYYFRDSSVQINGRPGVVYNTKDSSLAPIVRQTEGSCNLCANVTVVNQLAIDQGKSPVQLSGRNIEVSSEGSGFSYQANVSQFLNSLYKAMWPDGFVEGSTSSVGIKDIMATMQQFKANQLKARQESIASASKAEEAPVIDFPIEVVAQQTKKVSDLVEHLDNGGTAVLGGMVNQQARQSLTSESFGYQLEGPKAELYPHKRGVLGAFNRVKGSLSRSQMIMELFKEMEAGNKPDDAMVAKAMNALSTSVGHAVAAVRIIKSGPLEGHIVVANSWGVYEIHPISAYKNGLGILLVSPEGA